MADYSVRFTDFVNNGSIEIEENSLNSSDTSLKLPGQNLSGYGAYINENFLHLLENFANTTAPINAVEGQLWYDTTTGVDQLKVYDGAAWVAAGGIKKAQSQPQASESIIGDIWIDTANLQAYLYSGSGWILIGPDYAEGANTGVKIEQLVGTSTALGTDKDHTVLSTYVNNQVVSIYSSYEFTPKLKITGFPTGYVIKPGINLPSESVFNSAAAKYYGTAEKAEKIIDSTGLQSIEYGDIARLSVANRFEKEIRIATNTGISIGENGILSASVTGSQAAIRNRATDGPLDFQVNNSGANTTALRITSEGRHGILNTAPDEALDVNGNIKARKIISINDSESFNKLDGAITTAGGIGIAKSMNVGGNASFNQNDGNDPNIPAHSLFIQAENIRPYTDLANNIGTESLRYANVYANTFNGNLIGNVTGNVGGTANIAGKLASPTTFQFSSSGDVTASAPITFDGQVGGTTKEWTLNVDPNFIENQTTTGVVSTQTDTVLINRSGSLVKMTHQTFVSTIPTFALGMIMPFAGTVPPDKWVLCHGQELERGGSFEELYEIIGNLYGTPSDFATKFKVPDFRGRFLLGHLGDATTGNRILNDASAATVGKPGGSESTTITEANLPNHQHSLQGDNGEQYYSTTGVTGGTDTGAQAQSIMGTTAGTANTQTGDMLNADNDPFIHTPPFVTVEYIIYTGVSTV